MSCVAALLDFDPEPSYTPTCPGKSYPKPGWWTWPDVASDGALTHDSVLPAPTCPLQARGFNSTCLEHTTIHVNCHRRGLVISGVVSCLPIRHEHLQPGSHVKMGDITFSPPVLTAQYKSTGLPCPVHLSLSVSTTKALTTILQFFFRH